MAPPPPGPTLRRLLALIQNDAPEQTVLLGEYSSTALLVRRGERFELFALHGGVLGVSAEDDRPPTIGALMFEATGRDDLVSKLVRAWTSAYGVLLDADDVLSAKVSGDRRRLLIELRQRWDSGIAYREAGEVLDGHRPLDGKQARWLADAVAAAGGTIDWRCESTTP